MLDPNKNKIHAFTPEELKKKRDKKYPVVFPNGMVKRIECGPLTRHRGGMTVLKYDEGEVVIRPRYVKAGFEFYEDMCLRTDELDKWDLYVEMTTMLDKGARVNFPEECFCAEVIKRRQITRGEHPEATVDFVERLKEIKAKAKERAETPITKRVAGGLKQDIDDHTLDQQGM